MLEMHVKQKQRRYREDPADARAKRFEKERKKYTKLLAQVLMDAGLPVVELVKSLEVHLWKYPQKSMQSMAPTGPVVGVEPWLHFSTGPEGHGGLRPTPSGRWVWENGAASDPLSPVTSGAGGACAI